MWPAGIHTKNPGWPSALGLPGCPCETVPGEFEASSPHGAKYHEREQCYEATLPFPGRRSPETKPQKETGHERGLRYVRLGLHEEMQDTEHAEAEDYAMQARPVSAELSHPVVRRCQDKDAHAEQGYKPNSQVDPERNLACDNYDLKFLVHHEER